MRRCLLVACAALLATASTASASQLITIDTPSKNVNPEHVKFNVPGHPPLRANVLLPDGYDPAKRYPLLLLLHGAGDTYATWNQANRGDIVNTAKGLDAIVVMPEGAIGFYTNAYNDGKRGDPGWERFYLDELIPQIEKRFAIRPERRWHAIAGLSMGGLGATYLGGQLPGYFGSVSSFSGFVQHQRPTIGLGFSAVTGQSYESIFGPMDGSYATGHNPTRLAANLRSTRLFVASGDGISDPAAGDEVGTAVAGGVVEAEIRQQNDEFVPAARAAGDNVTYRPHGGVHGWPYWRADLRSAIAWGLFSEVPESPSTWTYTTVAQAGQAWGVRYAFASAPQTLQTLRRDGDQIKGTGTGTATITNAAGACGFTATLPFEHALPAADCSPPVVAKKKKKKRSKHAKKHQHHKHHKPAAAR